ncbi:hypothetical protein B124-14_033 [Bacteroides phage B124-14]|nr:hypothetical protein B124-14_033 [Bacteroides phage B124-14]CCE45962.1 hypothetical protein B124-14_033 [Bacteroides phage B124-14]
MPAYYPGCYCYTDFKPLREILSFKSLKIYVALSLPFSAALIKAS